MEITIIGDPERKEKDAPLMRAAKKYFASVKYAPITSLKIEVGEQRKLHCDGPINSNCVFPVPTNEYIDKFLSIIEPGNYYIPFDLKGFLNIQKPANGLISMKNIGFYATDFVKLADTSIPVKIREFPLRIVTNDDDMIAENEAQLRSIMRMLRKEKNVMMHPVNEDKITEVFIIGERVVAALDRKGRKVKKANVDPVFKKTISHLIRVLGSEYGTISFSGNRMVSMTLAPDFREFEEKTKVKVASLLMSHISEKIEGNMTVFDNIVDTLIDITRKFP